MNVRISKGYLRFRITRGEMDLLTRDGILSFSLHLGAQTVEYSIALTENEKPLQLDVQKNAWKLLVDRKDLRYFAESLPSREGIEEEIVFGGATLKLALEVDVRRRQQAA